MSGQSVENVDILPEILVVDDSKVIRLAAKKMLGTDYSVHLAQDGEIAWELLQQEKAISVVFTDLSMPNMNGMELLARIRDSENEKMAALPVVILTGADDTESVKRTVFDAGATDFISKPFESIDLISRAKAYAQLSQKVIELEEKVTYDKLTGLYSALSLDGQGGKAFSFSIRHQLPISAICFEIVDFQACFLRYGRKIAQHILSVVGKRLLKVMREEDIAARVGVAKFTLVLPMTNQQETESVIRRIQESINKLVFSVGKEKIRINLAIGYTTPKLSESMPFKTMLEQAEDALQQAMTSSVELAIGYISDVDAKADVVTEALPVSAPSISTSAKSIAEKDIEQAFSFILAGRYSQIPKQHLSAVVDRLSFFMQFIDKQKNNEKPGGSKVTV